jgi:hypothetical protein
MSRPNLIQAVPPSRDWRPRTVSIKVAAGLVAIALAEAAVIALLATRERPPAVAAPLTIESTQPGATVFVNGRPAGTTPFQLSVGSEIQSVRVVGAAVSDFQKAQAEPASPSRSGVVREEPAVSPTGPVRQGGVRLVSPIELTVLQGERVLGSTTQGPIFAAAGTQQLELVNTTLGYRVRQNVIFPPGRIATVTIAVPNGRLSVNAQPGWAEVFIDQKKVGETPLANISLTPGQHEVVFRHPKLGERRETVMVSPDTLARLTAAFDQ